MKRWQLALALAGFVMSLLVPLVVTSDYQLQVLFRIYLFAALGLAWNLVGGYAGQLSLGHAAYFGAGAYGLALFTRLGFPMWAVLALLVLLAMLFALLIGGVSFRLRGPYFALATIAFAEVVHAAAKNLPSVTGGDVGVQVPALFHSNVNRSFYLCAVILTAITTVVTVLISRSRFGYYLMAIREDQDTALAVGVNASRVKLYSLLLSAAFTALAGALYGSLFLFIVPDQVLSIDISNEIAIVAMLGGAGTLTGPMVGAVVLESASEIFKSVFQEAHLLIYGLLLIVVVLFLPEGIVGSAEGMLRRRKK
ncbi:MAG TPA: branched-chain amino acid ABC transporter permease [Patescibacteria group bacterium]|nr:branched-chain amino acid ABC transporter permease [Patescibacteria group bacterium]